MTASIVHLRPPSLSFAHDYRVNVLPQLSAHMPISATLIVVGQESFDDECRSIIRTAWNLGGWYLRDDLWIDLEDWISDQLLVAIDAIEAELGEFTESEDEEAANDFSTDIIYKDTADVG